MKERKKSPGVCEVPSAVIKGRWVFSVLMVNSRVTSPCVTCTRIFSVSLISSRANSHLPFSSAMPFTVIAMFASAPTHSKELSCSTVSVMALKDAPSAKSVCTDNGSPFTRKS